MTYEKPSMIVVQAVHEKMDKIHEDLLASKARTESLTRQLSTEEKCRSDLNAKYAGLLTWLKDNNFPRNVEPADIDDDSLFSDLSSGGC